MSVWDDYQTRIDALGGTEANHFKQRADYMINRYLPRNLSYTTALIDGNEQSVAIINSDNLNEKTILSLPGEDLHCGSLIQWMDNYWILNELDANKTLYAHGKLLQCNYLLKWVTDDNEIHEEHVNVEDGTKYMVGEFEDKDFATTRPDSRIMITMQRNEYTVKLSRSNRFLIDDPLSDKKMAYILTKPLKAGMVYNGEGVFKFICQEVTATDDDNFDLMIADYWKHFKKDANGSGGESSGTDSSDENNTIGDGGGWL